MDLKTCVLGSLVFGGVFAAALWGPSVVGRISAAPQTVELSPFTGYVEGTFSQVKIDPNLTPAQREAQLENSQIQTITAMAKWAGRPDVTQNQVKAAANDAPAHNGYTYFGTLNKAQWIAEGDTVDPNLELACFSSRVDHQVRHMIIRYDASHIVNPYDGFSLYGGDDLSTWVYSGCASTMSAAHQLNATQLLLTIHDLTPDTPAFAGARQKIMQNLNTMQNAAMHETGGHETDQDKFSG